MEWVGLSGRCAGRAEGSSPDRRAFEPIALERGSTGVRYPVRFVRLHARTREGRGALRCGGEADLRVETPVETPRPAPPPGQWT